MSLASQPDQFQPSLWERLSTSSQSSPSRQRRFTVVADDQSPVSRRAQLRKLEKVGIDIQRNIVDLLTTRQQLSGRLNGQHSLVATSVLCFGLPDFSGNTASGVDLTRIAELIRGKIVTFEPRLYADTVTAQCRLGEQPDELLVFVGGQYGPDGFRRDFALEMTLCLGTGQFVKRSAA